jgi:hypothetical protein
MLGVRCSRRAMSGRTGRGAIPCSRTRKTISMSEASSTFYLELTRLLAPDQIGVRLAPVSDGASAIEAWPLNQADGRTTFPLADGEQVGENAWSVAQRIRAHYADRHATAD